VPDVKIYFGLRRGDYIECVRFGDMVEGVALPVYDDTGTPCYTKLRRRTAKDAAPAMVNVPQCDTPAMLRPKLALNRAVGKCKG